ncbi:MAG: HD domain-containing protein [Vulcanimicrobiaceae bacterium]
MYSDRLGEALRYAAEVHATQDRKGTSIPYVSHLLAVAAIVMEHGGTEDEAIAALLHDAAEDQGGRPRLNDIRERFGDRVAQIVEACSDSLTQDPNTKLEWDERKKRYIEHLQSSSDRSAYLVSAADKLHNARCTLADFKSVGNAVWVRFNAGRAKSLQNYRWLITAYDNGVEDKRRESIVRELRGIIDTLESAGA